MHADIPYIYIYIFTYSIEYVHVGQVKMGEQDLHLQKKVSQFTIFASGVNHVLRKGWHWR